MQCHVVCELSASASGQTLRAAPAKKGGVCGNGKWAQAKSAATEKWKGRGGEMGPHTPVPPAWDPNLCPPLHTHTHLCSAPRTKSKSRAPAWDPNLCPAHGIQICAPHTPVLGPTHGIQTQALYMGPKPVPPTPQTVKRQHARTLPHLPHHKPSNVCGHAPTRAVRNPLPPRLARKRPCRPTPPPHTLNGCTWQFFPTPPSHHPASVHTSHTFPTSHTFRFSRPGRYIRRRPGPESLISRQKRRNADSCGRYISSTPATNAMPWQ
eukprot:181636-Chlamydomonas_euryale.AAC.3